MTNASHVAVAPHGKNPLRLGSGPECDVVLAAGTVPAEAAIIINYGDGCGWQLKTSCDHLLHNDRPLKAASHVLLGPQTIFHLFPYWITVSLDQDDQLEDAHEQTRKRNSRYAVIVQELHRSLLRAMQRWDQSADTTAEDGPEGEGFILKLEQWIEEHASAIPEFPSDDLSRSELAEHIAGSYCRSRILGWLADRANAGLEVGSRTAVWSALRTARPDHEETFQRLKRSIIRALELDANGDLTVQVQRMDAPYWEFWSKHVSRIPLELIRYLALSQLKKEIKDNWYGLGPLEDLLEDPNISEIMVNDADHIFIEKNGSIEDSGRRFVKDLKDIIDRIVARVHRKIDTSTPMVDARLPDGSRVNAIIQPLTVGGPTLTIRRFPLRAIDWELLIRNGSVTRAACEFLAASVRHRANILVSGGTASGKTTLLNALSVFIGERERIVTIEDTAELRLQNKHVVRLESRPKNIEGAGEVSIRMLVKNALRMRPDRIIVGECRGGESLDMLQAMNTGHDGSMTTIHANSPNDVISRLEVMVQQSEGVDLPVSSIYRQIVSAIDLIVHLTAEVETSVGQAGGRRRRVVEEISEVIEFDSEQGEVLLKPIFRRRPGGKLLPTGRLPSFIDKLMQRGFDLEHLKQLD
ncbi:MAG: CpaF family protein [Candidatus Saccharimonas sp.]|nr:CpaF family protein [Planctomycetaceae bacterium]